MLSHDGRYVLVFNGEIYNHHQLRTSLNIQSWRGNSDTETLVEGLAQKGESFLLDLRGMFAFTCYDRQEKLLILGRDRLGIKPLHVQRTGEGLHFASERQALGSLTLTQQEMAQVLSFGHLSTPNSLNDLAPGRVYSLPPGTVVHVRHGGESWQSFRYWPSQPSQPWIPLPIQSRQQAYDIVRQELERTVSEHLLADVPMASFLSRELDSGILTTLACRQQSSQIASFTVIFPGQPQDEQHRTARMARHCGSEHITVQLDDAQILEWIQAGLSCLDIPTADGLNTYLVSRAVAEQGIRVALSGLGADELFGGYGTHRRVRQLRLFRKLPTHLRQRLLNKLPQAYRQKLVGLPHWDEWHLSQACRRWYGETDLQAAGLPPLTWPKAPSQEISQIFGRISWGELFGYTEPMLLRDSDVLSMANGLELRVPFLDHQLVELALRMPQKFHGEGKQLLRESCRDLFPPDYLDQPKQGFELPMRAWIQGPLRDLCRERLQMLADSRTLNPSWVTQQWNEFEQGHLHWTRLWSLVVLGETLDRARRQASTRVHEVINV